MFRQHFWPHYIDQINIRRDWLVLERSLIGLQRFRRRLRPRHVLHSDSGLLRELRERNRIFVQLAGRRWTPTEERYGHWFSFFCGLKRVAAGNRQRQHQAKEQLANLQEQMHTLLPPCSSCRSQGWLLDQHRLTHLRSSPVIYPRA